MADKERLIKVQFTYQREDGSTITRTLEGDPEEWMRIINGYVGLHQLRNGRADQRLAQFTWKDERD